MAAAFQLHPSPHLLLLRRCSAAAQNPSPRRPISTSKPPSWIASWTDRPSKPLANRPKTPIDYRSIPSSDDDELGSSRSTGSSTMSRIVEKLKQYGYIDDAPLTIPPHLPEKGSVEDVFYSQDGILPNSRGGLTLNVVEKVRFPWEKAREVAERRKRSKTSLAELTLPEGELRRLRHMAIRAKSRTKIGGGGVTKEIVDLVHEKWRSEEVVRLKCEGAPALNMKRMHEVLEV